MRKKLGLVAIILMLTGCRADGLPRVQVTRSVDGEVGINQPGEEGLEAEFGEAARVTIPYLAQVVPDPDQIEFEQQVAGGSEFESWLVSYQSEGLTVKGLLNIPTSQPPEGGFPAVVFLHGYIQPDLYDTVSRYQDYVNYLSRNGLVVFKIDYRGHGSSQGQASGAYYSGDYVIDVINAAMALGKLDQVNPERIGLWGHSMSGNVVMRTMTARPEIKAGVIWAGAVYTYEDMQTYRINDSSFVRDRPGPSGVVRRSQELFDRFGPFDNENEFWKLVPATNYLNMLTGAIQLHHAVDDSVVNIKYSSDLAETLKAAGIEYEFYSYSSGGHNLSGSVFGTAMQRTVKFYREYL